MLDPTVERKSQHASFPTGLEVNVVVPLPKDMQSLDGRITDP
jgi:hypothetical protein